MEQRPQAGTSLKRGLSAEAAADGTTDPRAGPSSPKREKLQHDLEPPAGSRAQTSDTPQLSKQARATSVSSAAPLGDSPQLPLPSRAPATAKQQAVLRKHILVADPSLASQDALLEQVATVMKDTWSWDELRKFYLRKTEMRENVEATLELIRDDMDEDEEDAGELPAAPAAAGAGPADDLATESAEEGEVLEIESAASKPAPLASEQVAAGQEVAPTGALPSVASAPAALKPPPAASTSAQPSPDVFGSTSAAKKKPTKHLSSEQAVQLAREKALATGKVWIEPAKKKAMTALRTETEAQLERGEFHTFEAEDQAGRKYVSIRDVRMLSKKARCALMAVVISCEIRPPGRTDALANIKLQDPTGTLALNAFAKAVDVLPNPPIGSIIFLRNIYVDIWQGNYTVVGSAMDGYDWAFADLKVSTMSCPARLAPQYGSLEALSASQHSYAQKLSSWARFSLGLREAAPGAAPVIAQDAPSPIVVKKKRSRMTVEQLTESTEFFDLVAQIVKVGQPGAETRDIFVTDFSTNPRLFKFDLRLPPLAEAQKPSEPFGRYCLKISLFNELAKADNSSLAVGKIVKFRNAKVRNRDFLEGSLWGDRNSGCRVERLGLADEGVPELVERRSAFAQELFAEHSEQPPPVLGAGALRPSLLVAPWENPSHPILTIREAMEGSTFCCFGQVVAISQSFQAPEDDKYYRSFKVTDFTAHPRIKDEPDGDPGTPSAPPRRAFGRYTLRILLSGADATDNRADAWRTGDYLFFVGLRVNGKGGRGLEAYFHTDGQPQPYPIVPVPSPCAALGPLLRHKSAFYSRIGSPVPEEPVKRVAVECASPLLPALEGEGIDEQEPLGSQEHVDLDSLLSGLVPKGSAAPADRSGLLQDASVNSVIDGIFQIVQVQTQAAGSASLLVTDWTEHPLITERFPPLPNAEVVNVEEPFGRYVLEVQVLHPGLLADCEFLDALAPGAVVRLRGLMLARTANVGIRGHLTKSHSSTWERVREESQEQEVLALLSRRAATYQLSATQLQAAQDESFTSEAPTPPATAAPPAKATSAAPSPTADEPEQADVEMEDAETGLDPIEISPTQSFYTSSGGPVSLASVLSSPVPAKHMIRSRVVDYLPRTLEDVVVCICRTCNLILPTNDRVCRSCMSQNDASLGRDLEWTYRLVLKLSDGSTAIWAALFREDFMALFPSLPPASDYCDAATQIVDLLASQLSVLHPAIGSAHQVGATSALLAGPALELGLKSTAAVPGLQGVSDVETEPTAAFRIFRTILRSED